MTGRTYDFNWHEKEEAGDFAGWALTAILTRDDFARGVAEATEGFEKVCLGITVNGIEVDAATFMERLDEAVDHAVDRGVQRRLRELPRLTVLRDAAEAFEAAMREKVIVLAHEAGIELDEGWDRW